MWAEAQARPDKPRSVRLSSILKKKKMVWGRKPLGLSRTWKTRTLLRQPGPFPQILPPPGCGLSRPCGLRGDRLTSSSDLEFINFCGEGGSHTGGHTGPVEPCPGFSRRARPRGLTSGKRTISSRLFKPRPSAQFGHGAYPHSRPRSLRGIHRISPQRFFRAAKTCPRLPLPGSPPTSTSIWSRTRRARP